MFLWVLRYRSVEALPPLQVHEVVRAVRWEDEQLRGAAPWRRAREAGPGVHAVLGIC